MTPEVLAWDASSNNRFMLAGKESLALNAISITRTGENKKAIRRVEHHDCRGVFLGHLLGISGLTLTLSTRWLSAFAKRLAATGACGR